MVIKWFTEVDEPAVDEARRLLDAAHRGEVELVVPDVLYYEVGNVLRRRFASSLEVLAPMLGELFALDLGIVRLDPSLAIATYTLAIERDLTFYDAAYLATAQVTDSMLITADRRLGEAAGEWAMAPGEFG